ncbi:MAG: hypothetical protein Fur005_37190 [Roseiflexaceae bacterium]
MQHRWIELCAGGCARTSRKGCFEITLQCRQIGHMGCQNGVAAPPAQGDQTEQ